MTERIKILGTPGTGKTRTIVNYYLDLLKKGYSVNDITLITFRREAAEELVDKVHDSLQKEKKLKYKKIDKKELRKHIGTIHSIANRLSETSYLINNYEINNFIQKNHYELYCEVESKKNIDDESVYSKNLFDLYSWCRNTCTPFNECIKYPGYSRIEAPLKVITEFCSKYDAFKKEIGVIDFSDMIQLVIDNQIQLKTPILMIDEFQDLTTQMFRTIEMWSQNCEKVIIAGDPNQSIYGFFGGSPDYFNNWEAEEIILPETYRLTDHMVRFSQNVLKIAGMKVPEITALKNDSNSIFSLRYNDQFPTFDTEFHLVRCNFQIYNKKTGIAFELARQGKVFSDWTTKEINLANAIITVRNDYPDWSPQMGRAVMDAFPKINDADKRFSILKSHDPTAKMVYTGELFKAKMNGIKDRKTLITEEEAKNRVILTIHAAKGSEADAVFLHTGITKRIKKTLITPGREMQAEARVWYVGATRAKKALFIVIDGGENYKLPVVTC